MTIYIGLDIGAVSAKAAALIERPKAKAATIQPAADGLRTLTGHRPNTEIILVPPVRTRGRPLDAARAALSDLLKHVEISAVAGIVVTGSGGELVAQTLGLSRCNEFQALARAMDLLHPTVRTVFEIGGETSKYLRLAADAVDGSLGIVDYSTNGDCAAGTGSFLDQQANRLKYNVQEIGDVVAAAQRAAQIAGRCSVFAKSDMIHAQQKGFTPPEVLRGLCRAVALNFKSSVVKGRSPQAPVAFVGGVSANSAVVREMREAFELAEGSMFVPEAGESLCAVGAAVIASQSNGDSSFKAEDTLRRLTQASDGGCTYQFSTSPPLTLDKVLLLRDRVKPYDFPDGVDKIDAYLGIDIGSVGTKIAVIDDNGDVVHFIFTRTEGRPIEVVSRILRELEEAVGALINIKAVGTTGSGRELIGELVGADGIHDEITCHKSGAAFVGDRLLGGRRPDTIFEIGGQDSKYISLEREAGDGKRETGSGTRDSDKTNAGTRENCVPKPTDSNPWDRQTEHGDSIVVDFTMNEACAAGTGSFLEERAEELGVSIKNEFSRLALSSKAPVKLGERCTVFMERDVNTMMQRGAKREDIIAGLAYSIAYNYINRVVRGRHIGECIFFQGGTAYNDAVAAAFSAVTGKKIIVPPHNAVLGAIGAALLAKEKVRSSGATTRFRGYDVAAVDYQLREFTCKGCGNYCSVQEFTVEKEKTYWGDKCSDRYRKRIKSHRKPIIPDLIELRRELLNADDTQNNKTLASQAHGLQTVGCPPGVTGGLGAQNVSPRPGTTTIGIPMAMYTWDLLPLWRRFWRDCGFNVVVSAETNRKTVRMGIDSVVAEPCFPIMVAHGHVLDLVEQKVDFIWLPNILSAETKFLDVESHVCPWGQTLPYVIRQASPFHDWQGRILCPTLRFRNGVQEAREPTIRAAVGLGVRKSVAQRAFDAGAIALQRFRSSYQQAGCEALNMLDRTGEPGMVLVGRPYNIHDAGVSLSVAKKLRDHYGVNVVPIDAMPLANVNISDINNNMFWEYGRKIIAAARLVAGRPNLHIIYITNFKCGPDSFVKGFIRPASGKPFLTLQFDGHSNDAGMMTRCEAYLDSKGILRWWRQNKTGPAHDPSKAEPSTSPRCPTPVPG